MDTEALRLVASVIALLLFALAAAVLRRKPSTADHMHSCFIQKNELRKLIDRAPYEEFDHMQVLIDDFSNSWRGKVNHVFLEQYTNELNNRLANRVIDLKGYNISTIRP